MDEREGAGATSMEAAVAREAAVAYYETGSGTEATLRDNEAAWAALRFRPHVLRDVAQVDTSLQLLGATLPHPIIVAPSALHGLGHPDGELATARGAKAASALMALSMRSSTPVADVGELLGATPWWYQFYATRAPSVALALAERAVVAGARALVLTGDTPIVGRKLRPTPGIDPKALHAENLRRDLDPAITGDDIAQDPGASLQLISELRERFDVSVLVKGVLRGDDARTVIDEGAAGIIVSNHGGRQLDRAIATADALPEIVDAVEESVPVIVDGGIRSGLDALAALALGADAIMVGRPILRALMAGGAEAVTTAIDTMRTELVEAMQLVGAVNLAALTADLVVRPAGR